MQNTHHSFRVPKVKKKKNSLLICTVTDNLQVLLLRALVSGQVITHFGFYSECWKQFSTVMTGAVTTFTTTDAGSSANSKEIAGLTLFSINFSSERRKILRSFKRMRE